MASQKEIVHLLVLLLCILLQAAGQDEVTGISPRDDDSSGLNLVETVLEGKEGAGGPGFGAFFEKMDASISGILQEGNSIKTIEFWTLVQNESDGRIITLGEDDLVVKSYGPNLIIEINKVKDRITFENAIPLLEWTHVAIVYKNDQDETIPEITTTEKSNNQDSFTILINGKPLQDSVDSVWTITRKIISPKPNPPEETSRKAHEGCKAYKGFLNGEEIKDCIFPFSIDGVKYFGCADFYNADSQPFLGSDDPINSFNVQEKPTIPPGYNKWCPTVENYKRNNEGTRMEWGLCDCSFHPNSTFVGKQPLIQDDSSQSQSFQAQNQLQEAVFSGKSIRESFFETPRHLIELPIDIVQSKNQSTLRNFIDDHALSQDVGVLVTGQKSYLTYQDIAFITSASPAVGLVVLTQPRGITSSRAFKTAIDESITCFELDEIAPIDEETGLNLQYRCASQRGVARFNSERYETKIHANQQGLRASTCDVVQNLPKNQISNVMDADTSTDFIASSSAMPLEITVQYQEPLKDLITHYSLVSPSLDLKYAPTHWKLEALIAWEQGNIKFSDWVSIDEQENVVWETTSYIKWFQVVNPPNLGTSADQGRLKAFRLTFPQRDNSLQDPVGLAEFGVFVLDSEIGDKVGDGVESSNGIPEITDGEEFYQDGVVTSDSWYAPRNLLAQNKLNVTVVALTPVSSSAVQDIFSSNSQDDGSEDFTEAFLKLTSLVNSFPSFPESRTVVTLGSKRGEPSFSGGVDEFRIWETQRTTEELLLGMNTIVAVGPHQAPGSSETNDNGLLLRWSFDSTLDNDSDSEISVSDACLVPLQLNVHSGIPSSVVGGPVGLIGAQVPWEITSESSSVSIMASRAPFVGSTNVVYVDEQGSVESIKILALLQPDVRYETPRLAGGGDFGRVDVEWKRNSDPVEMVGNLTVVGTASYSKRRSTSSKETGDYFRYIIEQRDSKRIRFEGIVAIEFAKPSYDSVEIFSVQEDITATLNLAKLSPVSNLPMAIEIAEPPKRGVLCQSSEQSPGHFLYVSAPDDNLILSKESVDFKLNYIDEQQGKQLQDVTLEIDPLSDVPLPVLEEQKISNGTITMSFAVVNPDQANGLIKIQQAPLFATVERLSGQSLGSETRETIVQYASKVLRFSSQFATSVACSLWGNSACETPQEEFSAKQVLNGPSIYPAIEESPLGWKPLREDSGFEFIEVEIKTPVYITLIEPLEIFGHGAIVKISVADEYLDDLDVACSLPGDGTSIPTCPTKTKWSAVWERQHGRGLFACPVPFLAKYIRIELDTSLVPGWNVLDAVRVEGSLDIDSSLVTDPSSGFSSLSIRPQPGVYGSDLIQLTASNCEVESKPINLNLDMDSVHQTLKQNDANINSYFHVQPVVWVDQSLTQVSEIEFDFTFLKSYVFEQLVRADATVSGDSEMQVRFQGAEQVTFQAQLGENVSKSILQLVQPLPQEEVAKGNTTLSMEVSFAGLVPGGPVIIRLLSSVGLDCPQGIATPQGQEFRVTCSSDRLLLPGTCITAETSTVRSCDCYEQTRGNEIARRMVAGDACQYTLWSTCNGRGFPVLSDTDGSVSCICRDQTKFGGRFCEKRAGPINSIDELYQELEELVNLVEENLPGVRLEIVSVNGNETLELRTESFSRILQEQSDGDQQEDSLLSFNVEEEQQAQGTCHGHGQPTPDGQCLCFGFFQPPDCLSETQCRTGQFILREENPEFDPNNQTADVPEFRTVCRDCEVGHFCDSRHMVPCPEGTFAHDPGMDKCLDRCPGGGFYMQHDPTAINNISCVICPAGSSCDGQVSTLCEPGTFSPQPGLIDCILCNRISSSMFAMESGMTRCEECPENSHRINSPGISIDECVCQKGYWKPHDSNSSSCVECPEDGVCLGNTNNVDGSIPPYQSVIPYPEENFWGDPEHPTQFFECDDDACLGGPNYECHTGYENKLCFRCSYGYYNLGKCRECPGGGETATDVAFVFFAWTGIILAWVIINKASNEVRALDIALLFTQMVALVQEFDLHWPSPVNVLNTPFEVSGFEVDFLAPSCVIASWSFAHRFFLQLLLPLIYIAIQGFVVLIGRCHCKRKMLKESARRNAQAAVKNDSQYSPGASSDSSSEDAEKFQDLEKAQKPDKDKETSEEEKLEAVFERKKENDYNIENLLDESPRGYWRRFERYIVHALSLPSNLVELEEFQAKQYGLCVNFLLIVYPALVIIAMQPFSCMTLADGSLVMQESPDTVCWEGYHILLIVFSVVGIAAYVVGIPLYVYYILNWLEKNDLRGNAKCLQKYGFLYDDFKQKVFRWELTLTFRRFAFGAILVIGQGNGYIQATIACIVVVVSLTCQVLYKPFMSHRINLLDEVCLFVTFLYIFLGVVFTAYKADGALESGAGYTTSKVLSVLLLIASVCTLILAFVIFFLESRDYIRVMKSEATLVQTALREDVALVRTLRKQPETRTLRDVFSVLCQYENQNMYNSLEFEPDFRRSASSLHWVPKIKSNSINRIRLLSSKSYGKDGSTATLGESSSVTMTETEERNALESMIGSAKNLFREISTRFRLNRKSSKKERMLSFFKQIDADGGGTICKEEMIEYCREHFGLDGQAHENQLANMFELYDDDGNGELDEDEFVRMILENAPDIKGCELKAAFKSKYLINWVKSPQCTPLTTALFFELDAAIGPVIADDAELSRFRNTQTAKFYRKLVGAFPCVLDWLAIASANDVANFSSILVQLEEVHENVAGRSSLPTIVLPQNRPAVTYWLSQKASEKDRYVFKAVLSSLLDASGLDLRVGRLFRRREIAARRIQRNFRRKKRYRLKAMQSPQQQYEDQNCLENVSDELIGSVLVNSSFARRGSRASMNSHRDGSNNDGSGDEGYDSTLPKLVSLAEADVEIETDVEANETDMEANETDIDAEATDIEAPETDNEQDEAENQKIVVD